MTINNHRETAIAECYLNHFEKLDPKNGERIFNIIFDYEGIVDSPESILNTLERTLRFLEAGVDYSECKTIEDIIRMNSIGGWAYVVGISAAGINDIFSQLVKEEKNER